MLSFVLLPLLAVNDEAGTTGFASLENVYSARAIAMGQALTYERLTIRRSAFQPGLDHQNRRKRGRDHLYQLFRVRRAANCSISAKRPLYGLGFALKYEHGQDGTH